MTKLVSLGMFTYPFLVVGMTRSHMLEPRSRLRMMMRCSAMGQAVSSDGAEGFRPQHLSGKGSGDKFTSLIKGKVHSSVVHGKICRAFINNLFAVNKLHDCTQIIVHLRCVEK